MQSALLAMTIQEAVESLGDVSPAMAITVGATLAVTHALFLFVMLKRYMRKLDNDRSND